MHVDNFEWRIRFINRIVRDEGGKCAKSTYVYIYIKAPTNIFITRIFFFFIWRGRLRCARRNAITRMITHFKGLFCGCDHAVILLENRFLLVRRILWVCHFRFRLKKCVCISRQCVCYLMRYLEHLSGAILFNFDILKFVIAHEIFIFEASFSGCIVNCNIK